MKEINGIDAEDRRMRISMITVSCRVISNEQMKRHEEACSPRSQVKRKTEIYLKNDTAIDQDRYSKQRRGESPATIKERGEEN